MTFYFSLTQNHFQFYQTPGETINCSQGISVIFTFIAGCNAFQQPFCFRFLETCVSEVEGCCFFERSLNNLYGNT